MHSAAVRSRTPWPCRSICRRRSPSEIMPSSRPPASTTVVMPRRLRVISKSTSFMGVWGPTRGSLLAAVHHVLDAQEPLAQRAARVEHGEVLDGEPAPLDQRHGQGVAHGQGRGGGGGGGEAQGAGLLANGDVEVDVGDSWPGSTRVCRSWRSGAGPGACKVGSSATISSVSPLLEMAITTSPLTIRPRSPWMASAGCRKRDGVPVEAKVAEIFWPIRPLLPMPVTTTRARGRRRAARRRGRSCCVEARHAGPGWPAASISRTLRACLRSCAQPRPGRAASRTRSSLRSSASSRAQAIGVRPVGEGLGRVLVDLHEDAVHAGGHARRGQGVDEVGFAAGTVAQATRPLDASG